MNMRTEKLRGTVRKSRDISSKNKNSNRINNKMENSVRKRNKNEMVRWSVYNQNQDVALAK